MMLLLDLVHTQRVAAVVDLRDGRIAPPLVEHA
jgi:hypothetical protein